LHKQVLPFLLRRLKEDVLDDLPPKIIQDYYCDLSPLQQDLYESYGRAGASGGGNADDLAAAANAKDTHVFQTLQYLKRLVNHPTLVLQADNEEHHRILQRHSVTGGAEGMVKDIAQAPKLMALK
jgi:TATA-binding protein-associated factor